MQKPDLHLLALSMIKGLGPVTTRNLIAWCGGSDFVFKAAKSKLLRIPGIGRKYIEKIQEADTLHLAEAQLKACEDRGVEILSYLDTGYPQALTFIHNSPLILYKKGALKFNAQPAIAIVGTRKMTDYGREQTERFAAYYAERGINVVSGLAYGVDITAHRNTLNQKGITTAVLAHGFDQIYPGKHSQSAEEILERGAWLSEYALGAKLDPGNFPARNRIIAGMSKAVIVIEAAKSGGALITGRIAFDQNREVYAMPGRVGDTWSEGCNRLIRDQVAKATTHPQEVLDDLEIEWNEPKQMALDLEPILPLSPEETKIITYLNRGDAHIDSIGMQTKIPVGQLNAMLLTMEFRGLIRQMPGKKFRKL